jgi:aspartyl-tRNA(Asn)/glutamyl-tRNA(Gln) amidotransferase subunit B
MRSAEEAAAYLKKLRSILRYLGTCDGNMDEGSLRADVNVSVRKPGAPFGTRCEIKNVNSIRFVQQAVEYEARRQIELLEEGGTVKQQTRLFDASRGETRAMRTKEEAHDYRYFPDPDLLPLELEPEWIARIKESLPELPDEKKARFMTEYGLTAYDAGVLVAERASADYFEAVAKGRDGKIAANWIMGELFAVLNKSGVGIEQSPVSAEALGGMLDLLKDGTISGRIAKDVFAAMVETGKPAMVIVEETGLKQITDTGAIEAAADKVIADNPKQVGQYKGGNANLIGWFVGQVMKATGGKANPAAVNEILKKKLSA